MTISIWTLRHKAREFYPTSRHMRHQWLHQTVELLRNDRHLLQTGTFKTNAAMDSARGRDDRRV
jgi:hypothetical protein